MSNIVKNVIIKITADTKTFVEGLNNLNKQICEISKNITKFIKMPIVDLTNNINKIGLNFEKAMSEIEVLSGATGTEFEKLSNKIKELSESTNFTSNQIVEAFKNLATAGWDAKSMLDGISGVLNLAAINGENFGEAANIVSNSINTFGLKASESSKFVDILASSVANANTDINSMSESFTYIAPLASSIGYNIEDTAKAIALMGEAGIKGTQAATSLKSIFTNLINPTKEVQAQMSKLGISILDSNGNIKPLDTTIQELRKKFEQLTDAQKIELASTIAGKDAMSGLLAIINASEEDYQKLSIAIENSAGSADKMANQMQNNLASKFDIVKNGVNSLVLELYDLLLPAFSKVCDGISNFINFLSNLSDNTKKTILVITGIVTVITPLLSIGSTLISGGTALISTITTIGSLIGGLISSFTLLSPHIAILVTSVAALTTGVILLAKHLREDALSSIDYFESGISQATQKATQNFLNMNENVTRDLTTLSITTSQLTNDLKESIENNISGMAQAATNSIENTKDQTLAALQELFNSSFEFSEEEKNNIIKNTEDGYTQKIETINKSQKEISDILNKAMDEKRDLSEQEREIIKANQEIIATEGIKNLTQNEMEQKIILEKMKQNSSIITAEQAAEVVKNSIQQKENVIKEAEEQYSKTIAEIIKLRDEECTISEEQANKLIEEAQRQKNETVENAQEMHKNIVEEAKNQADQHISFINWETGEILTKWQAFWNDFESNRKQKSQERLEQIKKEQEERKIEYEKQIEKFKSLWNNIKDFISTTWDNIKSIIISKAAESKQSIEDYLQSIKAYFQSLPSEATEWGKNLIQGFINGIKSMASSVSSAVSNIINSAKEYIGFNSPAKKGEGRNIVKWGRNMIKGLTDGIESAKPLLDDTMKSYIPNLSSKFNFAFFSNSNDNIDKIKPEININLDSLFKGANLNVRNEEDIKKLAEKIIEQINTESLNKSRSLGFGGAI